MNYREVELFQPFQVNGMKLKNRVVFTPCVMGLSTEDGFVTEDTIKRYLHIARGGVGWLQTEAVVITPRKSPFNLRLSDDRFVEGLRRLTDTIHAETDCKIGVQLVHFLKIAMSGWVQKVEDVTKEEIKDIFNQHVAAAKRIKQCGFDSVEHDAETALTLSRFLSRKNKRTDEYGRTLKNRQRLLMEVFDATREILGPDYVLGERINGDDYCLGGTTLVDSTQTAIELARRGADYISVSCGGQWEDATPTPPGDPPSPNTGYSGSRAFPGAEYPEGLNVHLAEGIRKAVRRAGYQTPVITAGRIPTAEFAEEILQEGKADLIGVCRAILCDPDWVNKYLEGRPEDIVFCTYCNYCNDVNEAFQKVVCALWPKGSLHAPAPFLPKKRRK